MRTRTAIAALIALTATTATPAQSPPARPPVARFELISVKVSRNVEGGMINSQPGGKFIVVNMSLESIITTAFGIRTFQLVDAPAWVRSERFDINALTGADDYPSVVQLRPAIQALLADRFKLQVVREQRPMQTYALTRVRPEALGPQMRASTIDCAAPERRDPALNPSGSCGTRSPQPGELTGNAVGTALLAISLGTRMNTVVEDQTGLTGRFDFTLAWAPELTAGTDMPDLFTAIQEQLGLKLEPRRTPVDVVVVKGVERPTEN